MPLPRASEKVQSAHGGELVGFIAQRRPACPIGPAPRGAARLKKDRPCTMRPCYRSLETSERRSEKLRGAVNGVTNSMLPKTKPAVITTADVAVARIWLGATAASGY